MYIQRFRDIISDPNNVHIPRHALAGTIVDGALVMHNGVRVKLAGYYNRFSDVLLMNDGVHEPQEERVFMEVLKYIPQGGVMLELGSYWAFYSLWFYTSIPDAMCYMVEPDQKRLEVGRYNFKINNAKGIFTKATVGKGGITIDDFLKENELSVLDILHADIQGSELAMLQGAKSSLDAGKIKYLFLSTHSQDIHNKCRQLLEESGYEILASADFEKETFCYDGILVAKHRSSMDAMGPMDIGDRSKATLLPYTHILWLYVTKVIIPYGQYFAKILVPD